MNPGKANVHRMPRIANLFGNRTSVNGSCSRKMFLMQCKHVEGDYSTVSRQLFL